MRRIQIAILGLTCLLAPAAFAGDAVGDGHNIFFIKRSKNANEVHYDARIQDCRWRKPEVDHYWRELKEGPEVFERMQIWEVSAYGFDVDRSSDTEIRLRLKALPDRPIAVTLGRDAAQACTLAATIQIAGQPARLRSVFVHASENFLGLPTVHYIDILGEAGGVSVYERVPQTDKGRAMMGDRPNASRWHSGAGRMGRP